MLKQHIFFRTKGLLSKNDDKGYGFFKNRKYLKKKFNSNYKIYITV